MDQRRNLLLIDSDSRRRAAISHALSSAGIHVEPFEDVLELAQRWPATGTIFAEDAHGNIGALIEHMTRTGSWLPVIAFSDRPLTPNIVRAIMAGAADYVEWPSSVAEVEAVIEAAQQNSARFSSLHLREARARSRVQKLTRREREVLEGVAGGLSNRLIGERLSISPRTVEIHRANMLNKMGANHTSEAIRIAIEAALVA
jgi:two-component system, LuxR family, response regulator FixJ